MSHAYERWSKQFAGSTIKRSIPIPVRLALMVILNHVEPGFENSTAVISHWLSTSNEPLTDQEISEVGAQVQAGSEYTARRDRAIAEASFRKALD